MKIFRVGLVSAILIPCFLSAHAQQTQAPSTPDTVSATKVVTAYTLPPDLYQKAHDRNRIHFQLNLIGFVYGVIVLWLILRWKFSARFRDWAEGFSPKPFLQSVIFSPLVLLTIAVLTLPLDIYGESVEKRYGISVQSWGSWTWDWIKGQLIFLVIGIFLIWLLYAILRRAPRRGWFYFWLISLPLGVVLVFLQPLVIDPLFHKFEPLQQKDPALVAGLERMVQRAGQDIPPERMFWMGAGEKTTAIDAYVTGVGGSKRVVVWDNTIAKLNSAQIVYVCGHETGHYVLHHIVKGMLFFAGLLFVLFYLLNRVIGWVLARWGSQWGVRGLDDWASLPALLLLLSVFFFVTSPVACAFSRYLEHQADQYGLEVTHGLTPDAAQVAAQSFQILGEVDLSDPDPNPLNVFLYYTHDPIAERVRFCLRYDPWRNGGTGEFVK
jgi:Zn-dependent protease with chaperone function